MILAREFSHSIKLLIIAVFQKSSFQYPGRNNLTAYKYNIFLGIISIAFEASKFLVLIDHLKKLCLNSKLVKILQKIAA